MHSQTIGLFVCFLSLSSLYPDLTLQDQISPSEYESALAGDNTVNLAVVIKDVWTEERVLATQEFNISSPQIIIEVKQHTSRRGFVC